MAFVDMHKFLLFGDSITEQSYEQTRGFAFGAALYDVYRRKIEVLNRGYGGYNTAHALEILPKIIPEPCKISRIKLMTIFFGANDAVVKDFDQHIPLPLFTRNLKMIINHPSITPHNPAILLITPPPICEYLTGFHDSEVGRLQSQRFAAITKQYAEACAKTGEDCGVAVVDLWGACMRYAGWKEGMPLVGSRECEQSEKLRELLRDGLHLNPKGYEILYEEVLKTIKKSYPVYDPQNLEFVQPHWEQAKRYEEVEGELKN